MGFEDINDSTEAHERRITRCRGCNERIVFLPTSSGKMMPIDADTLDDEDEEYVHGKHVSAQNSLNALRGDYSGPHAPDANVRPRAPS